MKIEVHKDERRPISVIAGGTEYTFAPDEAQALAEQLLDAVDDVVGPRLTVEAWEDLSVRAKNALLAFSIGPGSLLSAIDLVTIRKRPGVGRTTILEIERAVEESKR